MFKSYMDETGINDGDRYCTVAGYVGLADVLDRIERDWEFVLGEFKVPYFHALEFYGEDKNGFYTNWKDGKRRAFIDALFDCLKNRAVSLFGASIDVEVFNSLTEDERRYLTGGQYNGFKWISQGAPTKPYFVPFQVVLIGSATLITPGDVLYPVMSRQEEYKMHALKLYEMILDSDPPLQCRNRLADDMVFSNPQKVVELQAADLGAYWLGKMLRHSRSGWSAFRNKWEMLRLFESIHEADKTLKLLDFQGLMLSLQGANRYIKTSFPTRDQRLPTIPVARKMELLSSMRKVSFRQFLDQWTPSTQACRAKNDDAL
jgi:hypothetical protein